MRCPTAQLQIWRSSLTGPHHPIASTHDSCRCKTLKCSMIEWCTLSIQSLCCALSAPSRGDDLQLGFCGSLTPSKSTQRVFLEMGTNKDSRLTCLCGSDTVAVTMPFAMKNERSCFLPLSRIRLSNFLCHAGRSPESRI